MPESLSPLTFIHLFFLNNVEQINDPKLIKRNVEQENLFPGFVSTNWSSLEIVVRYETLYNRLAYTNAQGMDMTHKRRAHQNVIETTHTLQTQCCISSLITLQRLKGKCRLAIPPIAMWSRNRWMPFTSEKWIHTASEKN